MSGTTRDLVVAVQVAAVAGHALPGGPRLPVPGPLRGPGGRGAARALGALLLAGGGVVAALAAGQLGRHLTPRVTPPQGAALRTDGLYGLSRHPLYAGLLAASAGTVLLRGRTSTLVASAALAAVLHVKSGWEDEALAERFGTDWQRYAARVPRLLGVPRGGGAHRTGAP